MSDSDYDKSETLRHEAFSHYMAGDHAKAIELYNESFDLCPNPGALSGLGECYSAMGMNRDAFIFLAASVGMAPHPRVLLQLSEMLVRDGHLLQAKKLLERAIAKLPHFERAKQLLAEIEQRFEEP